MEVMKEKRKGGWTNNRRRPASAVLKKVESRGAT
jgi:hypothetical protein